MTTRSVPAPLDVGAVFLTAVRASQGALARLDAAKRGVSDAEKDLARAQGRESLARAALVASDA